ncbi:MAG: AMP-binding protein [Janthinobacterium lividum]
MTGIDVLSRLEAHAQSAPWHPCLVILQDGQWVQLSYADMLVEVDRLAHRLARLELPRGALFCIAIPHSADLYLLFLAAMRAGLVPSFLAYATPKQQADIYWTGLAELVARARPACIVVEPRHIGTVQALAGGACLVTDADALARHPAATGAAAWVPPGPDDTALLQHSSGTTGAKKGVVLTHGQIARQVAAYGGAIEAGRADRIVSWLPLYHDMGLVTGLLLPISVGATIVSLDAFEWLGRPALLFEAISLVKGTLAWMPNFAFAHLVRVCDTGERFALGSMRAFISCSEPCKPATMAAFAGHFAGSGVRPDMLQTCYAMAEAVFAVTQSRLGAAPDVLWVERDALQRDGAVLECPATAPGAHALLSCGAPIDGIEVGIADAAGTVMQGDTGVGEIMLRGGFVFEGYDRNPEATRQAFAEGWYRTGDLGVLRGGQLYVSGRRKELVIVHGRNFYAHDIEEAVGQVAGVKPGRVAVLGRFDPASASEQVTVYAELARAGDPAADAVRRQIRQHVFDRLELTVRSIELFDPGSLVKTTSGKVARSQTAARVAGPDTGPVAVAAGQRVPGQYVPEGVL